jgi:hypothetical protein
MSQKYLFIRTFNSGRLLGRKQQKAKRKVTFTLGQLSSLSFHAALPLLLPVALWNILLTLTLTHVGFRLNRIQGMDEALGKGEGGGSGPLGIRLPLVESEDDN